MNGALRELIALSFLCGGALYLCPEGGTKRVVALLTAALLTAAALRPLGRLDEDGLALAEERLELAGTRISQNAGESAALLRRLAFEENCARYVRGRLDALGLGGVRAELGFFESDNGAWLPYAARFYGKGDAGSMVELRGLLRRELGIPEERQAWYPDG